MMFTSSRPFVRSLLSFQLRLSRCRLRATCRLLAVALVMTLCVPAAQAKPVRIIAPDEVAALIAQYLDTDDGNSPDSARDAMRRLRRQIPELLATEGYFAADVKQETGADGQLQLQVLPGRRFVIAGIDIAIAGAISAERRKSLLDAWLLKTGAPFRQAEWDQSKQAILRRLLARDHPKATLDSSEAEVDLDVGVVRLTAKFDAGERYRFGSIRILGLDRYRPELVERFNQFVKPGAAYRSAPLLTLQSELQNAPYFSAVSVELDDTTSRDDDGTLRAPVLIRVEEREPFQVGFGVGYSANTRARVETNFRSSDLLRRGWELNGGIRLEQLRQSTFADVFLPPEPSRARLSFGTVFEHSDIQGLDLTRFAIGTNLTQKRGAADMKLSLNWRTEIRRPSAGERSANQALTADVDWEWRDGTTRGDPDVGHTASLRIGGASKALLSDQDFVRVQGRYSHTLRLTPSDTLTLRAEGGITLAPSRDGIPQDFLFRTGGTNTVRGYAYQSLGVKEGAAIVGGRYFAAASAEAVHWLTHQWGAAAFVDYGGASDDRRALNAAAGMGAGARWRSPVGVLAADLAYGQRTGKVRLEISIAVAFR